MEIMECKMIKEIVAGKVTDDEITFSELKTLMLDNLPRLESFCSLNCVFNFPALENAVIKRCPKLKLSSRQAPITTKRPSVKEGYRLSAKCYWEDDLDSTVQKLYTDKIVSEDDLLVMYVFLDVDSESDDEHLNELDQFEVEEEDKVEEHMEHEEEKEENINGHSMGETTNDDKGLLLEILTEATSSLDSIIEEPMSELVLMDRQEGLEQNQVTIEFLDRTDVIPEAVHNAIELINRSIATVSTSTELRGLSRCSPISQPFSSITNAAVTFKSCLKIFPQAHEMSDINAGSLEEIPKQEPNSELVLTDQQLTLEGNKASRELQPLATSSHLSQIFGYPPSNSYQSLDSVAETSGPPLTSNAAIPSPLEDLLSLLHLFSSYEEMSYLRDGFSRYPWALHLLESWSDELDLSETLNADLNSSLNTLESVGFNANWIAAIRGRICYCQDGLTNVNEAKALRASKDVIASRFTEFELAMRTELARIDAFLAKYA
ncbi:hypothetical protein L6164_003143 [Bauhinia variegata]|uniref:Uncharacterized protein n=1 Tax=Bauhinia variegata TaxID=167791 RepID=A0ACB9Q0D6_BAUVA|nr:hypothetical protein L6164_003143 [Bauhinia variegata]